MDTNVISNVCPIGGPGNGGPGYSGGLEFNSGGNIVPIPPTSSVISGLKFNDLNGSGVFTAGDPGLAGWTIYVTQQRGVYDTATDPSAVTGAWGDVHNHGRHARQLEGAGSRADRLDELLPRDERRLRSLPVSHRAVGRSVIGGRLRQLRTGLDQRLQIQ